MMVPPESIPTGVNVDLTGVDIGKSIHVSMIKLPENCTAVDKHDFTILTIVATGGMKDEAAAAPAAAPAGKAAAKAAPKK